MEINRVFSNIVLAVIFILSYAQITYSDSQDRAQSAPQEVARRLFPRTALLTMKDSGGRPLSLGSGFVLKPGFIVSNFHVVEGAGSGIVKLINEKTTYKITGIAAKDESRDLAILAVEGVTVAGVTLSSRTSLEIGETVFAVGNPQGLEGTFSQGIISSIRELEDFTLLQITAPISPGSSGGPIADEHGEVVGVAVATIRSGQNLNFAVPIKYVTSLISQIGPPIPLNAGTKPSAAKSLFSDLGSAKSTEGVTVDSFLWDGSTPNETLGGDGHFSVSMRNNLDSNILNPVVLLMFHDADNEVIEYMVLSFKGIIPSGMAKRVKGDVDPSVKRLTTRISPENEFMYSERPYTKLVFRTLSFSLEEN